MQASQEWDTFRWSRITLLSNPVVTLFRMKVHVFSRIHRMERTWSPRKVQFGNLRSVFHLARTCYEVLLLFKSRDISGNTWTGKLQNLYVQRRWMEKECPYRNLFAQCQRSGSNSATQFCNRIQARTLVLPWARVINTRWNGNYNDPMPKWDIIALQLVDILKCHTARPIFPAIEPHRLDRWGKISHLQRALDNTKILNKTTLASNLRCISNRIRQWVWDWRSGTHTENSERRRANRSRTRTVDVNSAENSGMPPVRGDSLLTENRETLIHRASEKHNLPERWKLDNSFSPANLICRETILLFCAENTQDQGILAIQNYQQFWTITSRSGQWQEWKYSNLELLFVIKKKYRRSDHENWNLGCVSHEELKSTHDNLFLNILELREEHVWCVYRDPRGVTST